MRLVSIAVASEEAGHGSGVRPGGFAWFAEEQAERSTPGRVPVE